MNFDTFFKWGASIGALFILSSFFWELGFMIGFGILVSLGVLNVMVENHKKGKRLEELEEKFAKSQDRGKDGQG